MDSQKEANAQANGYTLVEIIVGMIIFLIILQGLAVFGLNTARANITSERMTAATMLARNTLEDIKLMQYSELNTAAGTRDYNSISGYEEFKVVTTITPQSNPNLTSVTIRVFWSQDNHSYQLTTIVSNT